MPREEALDPGTKARASRCWCNEETSVVGSEPRVSESRQEGMERKEVRAEVSTLVDQIAKNCNFYTIDL